MRHVRLTRLRGESGQLVPRAEARRRSFIPVAILTAVLAAGPVMLTAPSAAASSCPADTCISVNGSGGDKTYQGIGAVLGGGGNARYLMDYPPTQRSQILDYLFKPGYGASLQLLKLEIGGGTNSTDGSEPSVEPVQGQLNCNAGDEFAVAQQAVQRNSNIKLYGLQWTAPYWVSSGGTSPSLFTPTGTWTDNGAPNDINYLLDWLHCATGVGPCTPEITNCPASNWNLPISYIGGWNENNTGSSPSWYHSLRTALNDYGYGNVRIVAGDLAQAWPSDSYPISDVAVVGAHDICGYPNEDLVSGVPPKCVPPANSPPQQWWASELGGMDAGAEHGCIDPCAPAMDRSLVRGYHEANLTGYLEWPALDAMPSTGSTNQDTPLPYENRGLITADQPWSGYYSVRAMTWAIGQFTYFVTTPTPSDAGWKYEDSSSGYLRNDTTGVDGAYVTLIHGGSSGGDQWTTVVDTTSATASQTVKFTITGGVSGLAKDIVHVWSSNFDQSSQFDQPAYWLYHRADITPSSGTFTYTLNPGFVYTFTTVAASGQGGATVPSPAIPSSSSFSLPYPDPTSSPPPCPPTSPAPYDILSCSGAAGSNDDEPQYLAAQDGSFELQPCLVTAPDGSTTCTGQTTVGSASAPPVFWHPGQSPNRSGVRYPYALIGDGSWRNYTIGANVLFTQNNTNAGLIGRFTLRYSKTYINDINSSEDTSNFDIGHFNGYVFDVSTTGAWQLIKNTYTDGTRIVLDSGTLAQAPGTGTWHKLSLSFSDNGNGGTIITMSVDGTQFSTTDSSPYGAGLGGIEAGFTNSYTENSTTDNWPQVQFSGLSVTSP